MARADFCKTVAEGADSFANQHSGSLGTGCPWIMSVVLVARHRSACAWWQVELLSNFCKCKKSTRLQICRRNFPWRSITIRMNQVRTSVSWKTLPSVVCINPTLGRVSRTVQLQEFRCGIVGFLILVSNRNFCTFLVYIQAGFFCCFFSTYTIMGWKCFLFMAQLNVLQVV